MCSHLRLFNLQFYINSHIKHKKVVQVIADKIQHITNDSLRHSEHLNGNRTGISYYKASRCYLKSSRERSGENLVRKFGYLDHNCVPVPCYILILSRCTGKVTKLSALQKVFMLPLDFHDFENMLQSQQFSVELINASLLVFGILTILSSELSQV